MARGADHDPFAPGFANPSRSFAGRKAEFADLEQMVARAGTATLARLAPALAAGTRPSGPATGPTR